MKKNILVILLAALVFASCSNSVYHPAVFGERIDKHMKQDRVVRIFMDREGLYYPDIFIKDNELKKHEGSLRAWYKANPVKLAQLLKQYQVKDSSANTDENIERLDDAIARDLVVALNRTAHDYMVVDVTIHGFRKKAYSSANNSRKENQKLESALLEGTRKSVLFVEVYWDGTYFSSFKGASRGASIFYHTAIPNAMNAGLRLRKVIPMIPKTKEVNIIAANLGARVASELLFNATGGFMQGESIYNTPAQDKVKICLIAPAMGASMFENYNNRNPYNPVKGDNYELSIVYNENDLVAWKKLKAGPFVSGNLTPADSGTTTLGANYQDDVAKLKEIIKQPELKTFDLSKKGAKKRRCSEISKCYVANTVKFAEVADYLGDKATYIPPAPVVPVDKKRGKNASATIKSASTGIKPKSVKESKPQLTKAEKAKLKAEQREADKLKAEENKRKAEESKIAAKAKADDKRIADRDKQVAERQKMDDKRAAEQARKEAAKQKEAARKEAERERQLAAKAREQERKDKEKERAEIAKQKAEERKQAQKDREAAARAREKERKQAQKDKEAAAKQREKERKQMQKEKEEAAKERAKERREAEKERNREK